MSTRTLKSYAVSTITHFCNLLEFVVSNLSLTFVNIYRTFLKNFLIFIKLIVRIDLKMNYLSKLKMKTILIPPYHISYFIIPRLKTLLLRKAHHFVLFHLHSLRANVQFIIFSTSLLNAVILIASTV